MATAARAARSAPASPWTLRMMLLCGVVVMLSLISRRRARRMHKNCCRSVASGTPSNEREVIEVDAEAARLGNRRAHGIELAGGERARRAAVLADRVRAACGARRRVQPRAVPGVQVAHQTGRLE